MSLRASSLRLASLVVLVAGILSGVFAGGAHAGGVLRVLAWPGYADADVVRSFERKSGARVELTVIDSDESLWQKVSANGGGDFDVMAVNTAELQRYIAAGLVQPVDPARIPGTRRQLPRFRKLAEIPGLVHVRNGRPAAYAIPYTYSTMGLIYDRRQFPEAPASISALWDPRHRGRVLAYSGGAHSFSLAAQALGLSSPFRLQEAQWGRAVDKLIALRRNVLGFYTRPEESVQLFLRHGVALMFANYGLQQLHMLRAAGADVGYVLPREGALAWLDCWAIVRGARDTDLVHAWIDHLLGDTASSLLVQRQGLANTLVESGTGGPDDRIAWLAAVEDTSRRERLWARIHSGDRATRVMAP
ncbi:extracellular solute-binding protein [Zoogloea sp. LCSB751]|uniref:extracellular solute-binding protein n=1 Tax=Zoogloea sp. LCSB751 TaxID=1965277 RepID=UPI0009A4ACB8|nr:extracellular solute-binding protein [Zoogloea sp. LCSB751]